MRTIEYTVTKIILTSEEKAIRKSWGEDWKNLLKTEKALGYITLMIGTWSGYPGQTNCDTKRLQHCTVAKDASIHPYKGTIVFTDKTTLDVITIKLTLESLLSNGYRKNTNYKELINEMINGGQGYWDLNTIKNRE